METLAFTGRSRKRRVWNEQPVINKLREAEVAISTGST